MATQQLLTTDSYGDQDFYFAQGNSPEQFLEEGKRFFDEIPTDDLRSEEYNQTGSVGNSRRRAFYLANTFEELKAKIDTFIDMPLIRSSIDAFDGILEKIEMGGAFDKSRLKATSNPQGIFDFSLASQGLIRPPEYYSEELAKDHPNLFYSQYTLDDGRVLSGLVPPNLVQKKEGVNGIVFYFPYEVGGKTYDYLCKQRQVGVTQALLENSSLKTKMFGDMQILEEYNPLVVFRSKNKKCYLLYDKKGGKANYVELFVVQGGLRDLSTEGMLLKVMPVLLAADTLQKAGVKTRIYAVRAYYDGSNNVFMTYPIKNYNEDLDWNKIALHTADPRIFRFQMWRAITGWLNKKYGNIGYDANKGYGYTMYDGPRLKETFERYKNWAEEQRGAGQSNQKEVSRLLMLISTIADPERLQEQWQNDRPEAIKTIEEEFYRIMDRIDIQLSVMNKSANRITQRKLEKGVSMANIKKYISKDLIAESFAIPTRGQNATKPQTIQSILEKQNKLFDAYFEWANQN